MSAEFLINSIYPATEGEGIYIGSPQIFIRYQGCSIGCVNCDSQDTWAFDVRTHMNLADILAAVEGLSKQGPHPLRRISITGGDPLHPRFIPGLERLIEALKERQFWINIEAAGSRVVPSIFQAVDFISFDVKTPSTQVKTPLHHVETMARDYAGKFQIKSVIADPKDFDFVQQAREQVKKNLQVEELPFTWCLTPVYSPQTALDRENFISTQELNLQWGAPFRVIGQQHKWLYGPDRKRV